ncbi:MAG TPA: Tm-1-like ATP-binding domain-containing protein [Acidobacteriota bacterium]|nr:Tm-1-like ATP-binding domain-containing protein [Acidobacteriota bacterium]
MIALIAMLDEKKEEADFLRNEIESLGYKTLVLDIRIREKLKESPTMTRQDAINSTVEEKIKTVKDFYAAGKLSGIVGIGGVTGTLMGTRIMKSLPFGVPKLAVSSAAAVRAFSSRYIGTADINLMHSVVEITGLSDILKDVLLRAARGICGMVEGTTNVSIFRPDKDAGPRVALTQFNMCEICSTTVRKKLEDEGFQVICFHAVGIGDKAMEEIIESGGVFKAVIDLAPGGVGEELLGSDRAAGPTRLEAAGNAGIPQIVSLACVNLMSPRKSKYKPEYYSRKKHDYDASRTFVRLSEEEMVLVADAMAQKLNKARGPVKVVIPLGGWSSIDARGTDIYDPDIDRVFVDQIKRQLNSAIEVTEVDADLDTKEFAQAILKAFHSVVP